MSTAAAKRKQRKRAPLPKEEFKSRVREWALKLDVRVRSITVRPMSNKWASCSTAGTLNFNSELLSFDSDVADYVIVHELLHFFVPNHGKLWKSLMRAHLGDYESLDNRLRKSGL
ncbi:MAG TPA: M48 family metallopeptidase [Pyrinomonadaceae bacterium]|nr:M48 family metallopeptidase [Pyrinomonadaceae bacterium]